MRSRQKGKRYSAEALEKTQKEAMKASTSASPYCGCVFLSKRHICLPMYALVVAFLSPHYQA
jgi:hypothetical protein